MPPPLWRTILQHLLYNYGTDDRVTHIVDSTIIYVMPSMNPDGFAKALGHKSCMGVYGRENANGVDLNRNFPDQFLVKNPIRPETETKVIA